MDSLEVNKVIASVLVAGIAFFIAGNIGDNLIRESIPAKPAIKIEIPEAAAPAGAAAPVPLAPIAPLLAKADVAAGEKFAKNICAACHTFTEGGKAGIGPNLYGVVGAARGHMAGFNYSDAIKGKPGSWTYDDLNAWLKKPAAFAPGTRMTFAGVTNDQQRADVIAYLHTLSPNPVPYPSPEEAPAAPAPAAAAAAPAGDPPIESLLADADPKRGQADTLKFGCIACHTFNDGGKAGLGPNLYGVVGGPHAHMPGFAYSAGMKAKEGTWTYDDLNVWLKKPAAFVPGTKMTFVGVPDIKDRADVIAYLRSLAADPAPLPAK